jgi:hypothetical protein
MVKKARCLAMAVNAHVIQLEKGHGRLGEEVTILGECNDDDAISWLEEVDSIADFFDDADGLVADAEGHAGVALDSVVDVQVASADG